MLRTETGTAELDESIVILMSQGLRTMRYTTYLPSNKLKPFVKSFGIQETDAETLYKVLPDTSLVIGFQYSGSIDSVIDNNQTRLTPFGITGMPDRYRIFKSSPRTGTVLIFFKPAGAAAFFNEPLHEFAGRSISLDCFEHQSVLLLITEQLQEAKSDTLRIQIVEEFLLSRLSTDRNDELILEAIHRINSKSGNIKIQELSRNLFVSDSAFEKRFRKIVGISPKKYASLIRFKDILRTYRPERSLTDIAYESGFYDQAHFIKQFKTFTGETPEGFFSSAGK